MSRKKTESRENSSEHENQPNYLEDFEIKLSRLKPYPNPKEIAKNFVTNEIKLNPEKMAGAILWQHGGTFDILISNKKAPGYSQGIHNEILSEYQIYFHEKETWMAYLMTANEKRYLIVPRFTFISLAKRDELLKTLERYGVSIAFSANPNRDTAYQYAVDHNSRATIVMGDRTAEIDKLIWDDALIQIAKKYSLNIFEYLRLRLTGNLPEGRKPSMSVQREKLESYLDRFNFSKTRAELLLLSDEKLEGLVKFAFTNTVHEVIRAVSKITLLPFPQEIKFQHDSKKRSDFITGLFSVPKEHASVIMMKLEFLGGQISYEPEVVDINATEATLRISYPLTPEYPDKP